MKYMFRNDVFQYAWNQMAVAFWARYPNPYSQHILSEDTLEHRLQDGVLYVKRILTKSKAGPRWSRAYVSMPIEYVIEEVRIDPSTRTMTTYTRNIGHIKYVAADEKCLYRPATSAEGNATTSCDRQIWVSSGMRSAIGGAIQQYVFRSLRNGLNNTIAGWNWTLARLFQAPVVHVDEKMTAHQRMQHIADKFHDTALREKEKLRTTAEQAKDLARQSLATSSG